MKKFLLVLLVTFAVSAFCKCHAANGSTTTWRVITTTGITAIYFDRVTTEIYVVVHSTNTAYINWISTTPTVGDFAMGILDETDVIEHTEEINSSKMSVSQATSPVHIRLQWKSWKQ